MNGDPTETKQTGESASTEPTGESASTEPTGESASTGPSADGDSGPTQQPVESTAEPSESTETADSGSPNDRSSPGSASADVTAADGSLSDAETGQDSALLEDELAADTVRTRTTTVDAATRVDADGRWRVGLLLALVAGAAGVTLSNTGVFLAGIVGLVYAGYASLSRPPETPLVVERRFHPASPSPGARIEVTVRAKNVGSVPIADVRLADDPPAQLDVLEGAPRGAGTVEPGDTLTVSYALRAARGKYEFGDVVTVSRSVSGDGVRRSVHEAGERIVCHAMVESLPLASQTGIGSGRVETDAGGEGLEFFATRNYTRGDPASRVDWNRYATTGELTTVTYRESRSATVVFVVDGRHLTRRAPGEPTAQELCSYATVRVGDALLDAQNQVGTAILDEHYTNAPRVEGMLTPCTGTEQSLRIRALLRTRLGVSVDELGVSVGREFASATGSVNGRRTSSRTQRLIEAIPQGSQVVLVSPLLDETPVRAVAELVARDHVTTVISPDVTTGGTVGGSIERVDRTERVRTLTGTEDVRVVDWSLEEPLQAAVDRASPRWNA